jgi:DNA-binding NarL/FixJ family response regulator
MFDSNSMSTAVASRNAVPLQVVDDPDSHDTGARIAVRLWAPDPISLAGLRSELKFRSELELLAPGSARPGSVTVLVADSLDDETLSAMRAMRASGSSRFVLVVSSLADDEAMTAVDAGVSAVVWRSEATASRLSEIVIKTASGQATLPADLLTRVLKQIERLNRHVLVPRGLGLGGLSTRELDVLRLAADGLDTNDIALALSYSTRTVTSILHDVMHRYQLRNRTHAVAYALREGLI